MPTLEQRYELCAAEVTLDGKRAKITGARLEFARVTVLPDGPGYEWAWPTVARIVAAGGRFQS
jgi:hypothetical protein